MSCNACSVGSSSTPSATACRSKLCARSIMARTSCRSLFDCSRLRTKARSIFSSSRGSCRRYARQEYPVPKSSTASLTPSCFSRCSREDASEKLWIMELSTISRVRKPGSTPQEERLRATTSGRSGSRRLCGDRFTLICIFTPALVHALSCRSDALRMPAVSAPTLPSCSAAATRSCGDSKVPSGNVQRSKASAESQRPLARLSCGWYAMRKSLNLSASRI